MLLLRLSATFQVVLRLSSFAVSSLRLPKTQAITAQYGPLGAFRYNVTLAQWNVTLDFIITNDYILRLGIQRLHREQLN